MMTGLLAAAFANRSSMLSSRSCGIAEWPSGKTSYARFMSCEPRYDMAHDILLAKVTWWLARDIGVDNGRDHRSLNW